jgi:hypothetical protein
MAVVGRVGMDLCGRPRPRHPHQGIQDAPVCFHNAKGHHLTPLPAVRWSRRRAESVRRFGNICWRRGHGTKTQAVESTSNVRLSPQCSGGIADSSTANAISVTVGGGGRVFGCHELGHRQKEIASASIPAIHFQLGNRVLPNEIVYITLKTGGSTRASMCSSSHVSL